MDLWARTADTINGGTEISEKLFFLRIRHFSRTEVSRYNNITRWG